MRSPPRAAGNPAGALEEPAGVGLAHDQLHGLAHRGSQAIEPGGPLLGELPLGDVEGVDDEALSLDALGSQKGDALVDPDDPAFLVRYRATKRMVVRMPLRRFFTASSLSARSSGWTCALKSREVASAMA